MGSSLESIDCKEISEVLFNALAITGARDRWILAYFNSDSFHHDSLLNLKHVGTSRDNPYPVN